MRWCAATSDPTPGLSSDIGFGLISPVSSDRPWCGIVSECGLNISSDMFKLGSALYGDRVWECAFSEEVSDVCEGGVGRLGISNMLMSLWSFEGLILSDKLRPSAWGWKDLS